MNMFFLLENRQWAMPAFGKRVRSGERARGGASIIVRLLSVCVMALSCITANTAMAESVAAAEQVLPADSAHRLVQDTTVELLALIENAKSYIDEDEDRYYGELEALLRPFVDFHSFARAVMGRHASGKKMQSLTSEQADVLKSQIDRFSDVFAKALITTYSKGLLAFEGERVEVVPPSGPAKRDNAAKVKQLIFGDREKPYEIYYSMRKNSAGEWKLRNMVIESVNLGKIYRNQFDNSYQVYEGDIDRVIDNWVVTNTGSSEG